MGVDDINPAFITFMTQKYGNYGIVLILGIISRTMIGRIITITSTRIVAVSTSIPMIPTVTILLMLHFFFLN